MSVLLFSIDSHARQKRKASRQWRPLPVARASRTAGPVGETGRRAVRSYWTKGQYPFADWAATFEGAEAVFQGGRQGRAASEGHRRLPVPLTRAAALSNQAPAQESVATTSLATAGGHHESQAGRQPFTAWITA
jgi:hypothetical protein